jgi:hypothetical protein
MSVGVMKEVRERFAVQGQVQVYLQQNKKKAEAEGKNGRC